MDFAESKFATYVVYIYDYGDITCVCGVLLRFLQSQHYYL